MKKYILNFLMKIIAESGKYSETKLAEIKYGLEGIYLTISKIIIILLLAYLLNIMKEVIIFIAIYNIIRLTSFGLHATKSWICLVSSLIIFICIPYLCTIILIPAYIKSILGIVSIIWFYKYAPADTEKRPIVSFKRRITYKFISVIIVIAFSICSLFTNNFISNCLIFSLIIQSFIISPYVYKLFNLPYNNYITYLQLNTV